jgi:hypothetical protein
MIKKLIKIEIPFKPGIDTVKTETSNQFLRCEIVGIQGQILLRHRKTGCHRQALPPSSPRKRDSQLESWLNVREKTGGSIG